MKKRLLIIATALSLAFAITACCGGGETTSTGGDEAGGEKSADGFVKIPNSAGLMAKVPDNAKPNGIGGAAGFHSDDKSFSFTIRELKGEKTMEEAKKEAEEFMFKEWIGEGEKTDDGWVLTYKAPKMDMAGDEPKEVGVLYSFEVVKKVDGKTWICNGAVADEAGMKAAVDACKSGKKG